MSVSQFEPFPYARADLEEYGYQVDMLLSGGCVARHLKRPMEVLTFTAAEMQERNQRVAEAVQNGRSITINIRGHDW